MLRCIKAHEEKQISWNIIYYVYVYQITRPSKDLLVIKTHCSDNHYDNFAFKSFSISFRNGRINVCVCVCMCVCVYDEKIKLTELYTYITDLDI